VGGVNPADDACRESPPQPTLPIWSIRRKSLSQSAPGDTPRLRARPPSSTSAPAHAAATSPIPPGALLPRGYALKARCNSWLPAFRLIPARTVFENSDGAPTHLFLDFDPRKPCQFFYLYRWPEPPAAQPTEQSDTLGRLYAPIFEFNTERPISASPFAASGLMIACGRRHSRIVSP